MPSTSYNRAQAHVVGFYTTERFLISQITEFVAEGLEAGEQVLVLATKDHWRAVAAALDARGTAHGHATARGQLVIMDADGVLDQVMRSGAVDVDRFRAMLTKLLSAPGPKRMYGELVGSLTARGDIDGAAQVEAMVHEVSHSFGIPILCGYNVRSPKPMTPGDISRLEGLHDRAFSEQDVAPSPQRAGHFHAVRFYADETELTHLITEFLDGGLQQNETAVVFATGPHRDLITEALRSRGLDLPRLTAEARLILLDAADALAQFMVDGMPDPGRFREVIGAVLNRAGGSSATSTVRAYGEMVDILWRQGHTVAATRLEMLWNELAKTREFSLLCGYSMGHFYKNADVQGICEQHSHVVSGSGATAPIQ